jgi:hypothetical protein
MAVVTVVDVEEAVPPSPLTSRRKSPSTRSSSWRSLLGKDAQHTMEDRTLHLGVRMHHHHHHHFWLR